MKSIALITYKELPTLTESDRLLIKPLEENGFQPHVVCWDEKIDWKQFDSVILRSCWDYHTRVDEFLIWLNMLEQQEIPVWNPIDIVRWNYKKTYLKELEDKGITIIPTVCLEKDSHPNLKNILNEQNWKQAVIKPVIGLGASDLLLVSQNEAVEDPKNLDDLLQKSGVMIQPFVKEIQTEGELSNVFIGGQYSHTVLKRPLENDFRSNDDYGAIEKLVEPSKEVLEQVVKIYQKIQTPLLYARVDGILINNVFHLMELELIEPSLFLNHFPQGATQFVHALQELSKS